MQTEHLQDRFLHQLRTERTPITLFLVNGFQIRGRIWCVCAMKPALK